MLLISTSSFGCMVLVPLSRWRCHYNVMVIFERHVIPLNFHRSKKYLHACRSFTTRNWPLLVSTQGYCYKEKFFMHSYLHQMTFPVCLMRLFALTSHVMNSARDVLLYGSLISHRLTDIFCFGGSYKKLRCIIVCVSVSRHLTVSRTGYN